MNKHIFFSHGLDNNRDQTLLGIEPSRTSSPTGDSIAKLVAQAAKEPTIAISPQSLGRETRKV
ncbi:hypothetical protein [Nostoc sphaeroides]|uniref:Uncharacterized protein n=2 Tax=Nostoc sphaeroides TaxID=446679 RepID=A0A5P8W8I9_9NOSO|nr:hypothetical protein [Nostoc sphaeroides]QFS49107.1 hypothetical protein GXM_06601 [Nostoc sphaeroides CCNUC1]